MGIPRPLDGVRVLDLSRVFAGPVAGRVLAELGAEVVKVEPPEGDVTRLWGKTAAGLSTYFTSQNVGKQDICVDLTRDGGPELVAALAEHADIVVENFRPGVMARFGLDYAELSRRKPDLIMLSISGFGQTGPESGRAAYASVVHAETGLIEYEQSRDPQDVSFSAADVLSGMHGVVGVLAALRVKEQSGIGQHIDLAMMDAMAFSSDTFKNSLDGRFAEKMGGEVYDTASGPMNIAGGLRWIWHTMSKTHGIADPSPDGADVATKIAARRKGVVDYLCGLDGREAVVEALDAANLAWGEVKELGAVLDSPTFEHRGTVTQIDDRAGGTRPIVRAPYVMSESGTPTPGVAPFRGEHNTEVLTRWLKMDHATIDGLVGSGVLLADEWASNTQPSTGEGKNT